MHPGPRVSSPSPDKLPMSDFDWLQGPALIPIIGGAGGIITTWEGKSAASGGRNVASGDKRAHAEALKLLDGQN